MHFDGLTDPAAVPEVEVTHDTKDTTITVSYAVAQANATIIFIDDDANGQQVGKAISFCGAPGAMVNPQLTIPANYQLAKGQTLPLTIALTNETLTIHLVHEKVTVDPAKPETNPAKSDPNWFQEHDLQKNVTRTINYEGLPSHLAQQIPHSKRQQTVKFTRTAVYDMVTGKLLSTGAWTPNKGAWSGFRVPMFRGYNADSSRVARIVVGIDSSDQTLTISYTKVKGNGKKPNKPGQGKHHNSSHAGKHGSTIRPGGETVPPKSSNAGSLINHNKAGQAQVAGQQVQGRKNSLPQTGASDQHLGLLGLLLTGLGLFGLTERKKRKDQD